MDARAGERAEIEEGWTEERPWWRETLAALDLGTNNCRLLVARPERHSFSIIDSFSRIVRLGEGVAQTGRLSESAITRTLAAMRVCARIMARHQVRRSRSVATEACRRAVNGVDFLTRVRRQTGVQLEILPHEQEAQLALLGCLPLLEPSADHVILVDIGGGSTEILWLDVRGPLPQLRCCLSLPVGVVALSETFGAEPDAPTYDAMVEHASALLAPVEAEYQIGATLAGSRVQFIGTSGTVTTLAAMHLGLPRYDRRKVDGLVIDQDAVTLTSRKLRSMTNNARASHPCIGHGRADLVVAGSAVLEACLSRWPVSVLTVADRGLREGILQGLVGHSLEQALAGDRTPDDPLPRTDRIVADRASA